MLVVEQGTPLDVELGAGEVIPLQRAGAGGSLAARACLTFCLRAFSQPRSWPLRHA